MSDSYPLSNTSILDDRDAYNILCYTHYAHLYRIIYIQPVTRPQLSL